MSDKTTYETDQLFPFKAVGEVIRTLYVAGIDRAKFAYLAAPVDAWLLSAGYLKNLPLWVLPYLSGRRILWDPGVFSVSPSRQISLEEYKAFMRHHHQSGMRWLSYDAIGDPEQTWWNLKNLRSEGFGVVPVYQHGMPTCVLLEPDLAIGGPVPLTKTQLMERLDWVFGEIRPRGAVHLLGMKDRWIYERWPAQSGDSTSWLRWLKFREGPKPETFLCDYGDHCVELPELAGTVQQRG